MRLAAFHVLDFIFYFFCLFFVFFWGLFCRNLDELVENCRRCKATKLEIRLNPPLGDRLDRSSSVFRLGDRGLMSICIVDDKRLFSVENLV